MRLGQSRGPKCQTWRKGPPSGEGLYRGKSGPCGAIRDLGRLEPGDWLGPWGSSGPAGALPERHKGMAAMPLKTAAPRPTGRWQPENPGQGSRLPRLLSLPMMGTQTDAAVPAGLGPDPSSALTPKSLGAVPWLERESRIAFAMLPLAILTALAFVLRYSVNLPWWDEWETVRMLQAADEGTLGFGDLTSLHNEHRILVPRLIMLGLAWLTDFDTRVQGMFTVLHLGVLATYAYAAVAQARGCRLGFAPWWFAPMPWLLLGWRQAENLLWGFQVGLSLPLTFGLIAMFHLLRALGSAEKSTERPWPGHLPLAILAGFGASYSSAMGLFVWPCAALGALLLAGRSGWRTLCIWIGCGALAWSLYFVGYARPGHHAPVTSTLEQPFQLIEFFLVECGTWATGTGWAPWVGALQLTALGALLVAAFRRGTLHQNALWLSLCAYGLGTLAVVALGRSGKPDLAFRSAYATYCLPVIAAMLPMLASWLRSTPTALQRFGGPALLVIIAAATWNGYRVGHEVGSAHRKSHGKLAEILVDYRNRSDGELALIYGYPDAVRSGADFLADKGWSVFRNNPPRAVRTEPQDYHFGDMLKFGDGGNARPFLGEGWSLDETGFVWTDGEAAELSLAPTSTAPASQQLRLELGCAMVYQPPGSPAGQRVKVRCNGAQIGELRFTDAGWQELTFPSGGVPPSEGTLRITLELPDAVAPASVGDGIEGRRLALAVYGLRLSLVDG